MTHWLPSWKYAFVVVRRYSPRVPGKDEMVKLLRKAAQRIPAERLWVNPDCGLKTRAWPETEAALVNMVAAARELRKDLALLG